jgi:hypothetical protein
MNAGKGVPVDLAVAVEFSKTTSDSNDVDGQKASVVVSSRASVSMGNWNGQISTERRSAVRTGSQSVTGKQ